MRAPDEACDRTDDEWPGQWRAETRGRSGATDEPAGSGGEVGGDTGAGPTAVIDRFADSLIDRRRFVQLSATAAGTALLGVQGSDLAAADHVGTTEGETEPRYRKSEAEPFYVDTAYENVEGDVESPTLYGEIVRPVDENGDVVDGVPVILTYSPYNDLYAVLAAGDSPADDGVADFFVPRGYARAQFDLVGTRNSEGIYDYGGIRERKTGAQLVDALGEMAWSNGNVGMIGGSYDGTTQHAAAVEDPDHLAAIVPQVAIDRWYDYKYCGGVPYNFTGGGGGTPYLFDFGFAATPPTARDGAQDVGAITTRAKPGDRVEHTLRSTEYDPDYDAFWEEREYRKRAGNVSAAVMVEGGWQDRNVKRWGDTRFFEALPDDHPKRLLMGSWGHSTPQFHDAQAILHSWFDHWLVDGVATNVMDLPPVDTASATSPRTGFETWPPEETKEVALPLVRSDADAGELGLLGGLASYEDRSPPVRESEMFDERGSGERYLMFETPRLREDARITGRVLADLLVASAAETWFTPIVYDRAPDGSHEFIARGFRNARQRNGDRADDPVPTDRAYRCPTACWDIDWTVGEGYRIGLVVASDNEEWVRHDPRMQGRNEVVLGDSTLRLDVSSGRGALGGATFPAVDLARSTNSSVHTAGGTARFDVTVTEADRAVWVRDRLPDGWTVVGGDASTTTEQSGARYVAFDAPIAPGETATYFAEAPSGAANTGRYTFGPLEYGASGAFATAQGTTATKTVVGVDTDI
jgi:X-Pro dipeptidyl-peptidase